MVDYPVELKITVSGDVDDIVTSLGLKGARTREVWFLEDNTPGLPAEIPLLAAGVILRLRTDTKRDQSTVKLRPARRSQLVNPWLEPFEEGDEKYRIEGDWAGGGRKLAASCVAEFPPDTFEPLLAGDGDLTSAFTERQRRFIADCAGIPLNISALTAFGPIASTQWKDQKLDDVPVDAERWRVGTLDFLEISARVDDSVQAVETQTALAQAASAHGLVAAADQEPKTTAVLEYLMRQHRQ